MNNYVSYLLGFAFCNFMWLLNIFGYIQDMILSAFYFAIILVFLSIGGNDFIK